MSKTEIIYTKDYPKKPKKGDVGFTLFFPLPNGDKLEIKISRRGMVHTAAALLAMMEEDKSFERDALKVMRQIMAELKNEDERN